jgi:hypothetical protein
MKSALSRACSFKKRDGASVLFWKDSWQGLVPALAYPELFSFVKKPNITFQLAASHRVHNFV